MCHTGRVENTDYQCLYVDEVFRQSIDSQTRICRAGTVYDGYFQCVYEGKYSDGMEKQQNAATLRTVTDG